MFCKCGHKLEFNDNSCSVKDYDLSNWPEDLEIYSMYYCSKCDVVWDGKLLDLEDVYERMNDKYKGWFKKVKSVTFYPM